MTFHITRERASPAECSREGRERKGSREEERTQLKELLLENERM